jgi:uncharacterized membrane protein YfcA
LLPILIVQDAISVWAFRHSWNRRIVAIMLPGALVGIFIGWTFAAILPEDAIMAALGMVSILFGLWRLWADRGGQIAAPSRLPEWVGALFGAVTGFTSPIAHAGGPPFQMWVAPKRLPHVEFVGTSSVLFAAINWAKVPAYAALGQFSAKNMTAALLLMPLAILSTYAGVWIIRRINAVRFYTLVYLLMIALGIKLIWTLF